MCIVLCLISIFSEYKTVIYKSVLNAVCQLELILAKISLIFKVWVLVTYVTFLSSQITNKCT